MAADPAQSDLRQRALVNARTLVGELRRHEQEVRCKLPDDFQGAELLLKALVAAKRVEGILGAKPCPTEDSPSS
jgi:hypothetical protein